MYIYGKNVAIESLEKNKHIKKAYIYEKFNDKNIINQLNKKNINTI